MINKQKFDGGSEEAIIKQEKNEPYSQYLEDNYKKLDDII